MKSVGIETDEQVAGELAEQGFSVRPGFLDAETVARLRRDTLALWESGAFRAARVGARADSRLHSEVRSDWIRWLDPAALAPAERELWEAIERLRLAINGQLMLGLFELEAHLAVYPPGACYTRHLDQFRGTNDRVVSCIVYLNQDWTSDDGGELRLHLPDEDGGSRPFDVLPQGGTLACFLSAEMWHEVLPAKRERLSVTGWLRKRG